MEKKLIQPNQDPRYPNLDKKIVFTESSAVPARNQNKHFSENGNVDNSLQKLEAIC